MQHGEMTGHGYGGAWMVMSGGGLLFWLIGAALIVAPFWMILPRTGISKGWALVAMFPLAALVLLWVVALRRWPNETGREDA
jgi:LPXTG-motif cell wall-anchored protein